MTNRETRGASADAALAERVQRTFALRWLRIYTNTDVVGVEIAGAAKNVVALAAGMVDGLGLGSNAKSALLARGLAEIVRLGSALGARPETFFGIAGVGDLATTCFSPEGRNRSCGEAIGSGEPLASYLARTNSVVEGVATSHALLALAQKHGVDMPIVRAVESILFHGKTPAEAIRDLIAGKPPLRDLSDDPPNRSAPVVPTAGKGRPRQEPDAGMEPQPQA